MFKLNTVPSFTVRVPGPSGIKTAKIRYPKDQEWCARVHRLRIIRRPIGRDLYQSDVPKQGAADLELLNKILVDCSETFDEAEASLIIDRIDRSRVVSADLEGQQFRIVLDVDGNGTVHLCKIPAPRDLEAFNDSRMKFASGKRHTEITPSLEPAAELYGKVIVSTEGYAGDVPITHKFAVVSELADQVAELVSELEIELPEA
jgi:hypothetical protein